MAAQLPEGQHRLSVLVLTFGGMERKVILHIEKLPEGLYLATSDSVQGLVAQGRTIAETLEIARDIAKKLLEAQEPGTSPQPMEFGDRFEYPLVVGI